MRSLLAASAAAAFALLVPRVAAAQVHWDAALQAGVEKRFLTGRAPGADNAGFGPFAQLSGHIALLPLVRVGGYIGHDISPLGGDAAARDLTWGGLHIKAMSPWPRGNLRAWLFFGFGYTGMYARSYHTTLGVPGPAGTITSQDVLVHGSGGGFFEVPFGIGVSYKVRKPWELFLELGARVGFASHGSAYDRGPRYSVTGGAAGDGILPSAGTDRFGLGLSLGILVDN